MACDTVSQHQLFVKFITAHLCQVISPGIKKHAHDQALGAVHSQRLTRTDLLIQLKQSLLVALGSILCQAG